MDFLKRFFSNTKPVRQNISVKKYPNRFFFETYDRVNNSFSTRSKEITILNIDSTDIEIGETILRHLRLSKIIQKITNEERKENDEFYKKITGLKSMKAQMKDSLSVWISLQNNQIEFSPTINGGTTGDRKGYHFLNDEKIVIENSQDFELIGKSLKLALEKCY